MAKVRNVNVYHIDVTGKHLVKMTVVITATAILTKDAMDVLSMQLRPHAIKLTDKLKAKAEELKAANAEGGSLSDESSQSDFQPNHP